MEFESEDSVMEALRHGGHSSRQGGHGQLAIPVTSPFMWFSGKDVSSPSNSTIHPTNTSNDNVPIYVPTQKMMDKSDQGLEASLIEKNTVNFKTFMTKDLFTETHPSSLKREDPRKNQIDGGLSGRKFVLLGLITYTHYDQ